jgi:GT2 family glycosyltransferase
MQRLSIVLNTRNKLPYLRMTLRALADHARGARAPEVVIVDDGSTDGTRDYLERSEHVRALGATVVHLDGVGLAASRNAGVRATSAPHVLFMDNDIVLGSGFLRALERHVQDFPDRVHLGSLRNVRLDAVRELMTGAEAGAPAEQWLAEHCAEHAMYDAAAVLFRHANATQSPAVWWAVVTGGNLCVPRSALEAVGGFDPRFTGWGPEDAELCYRLFLRGVPAAYHADCRLYHLDHARDGRAVNASMIRNTLLLLRKHGAPPELRAYLLFFKGLVTLEAFNRETAERFGLSPLRVDDHRLAMLAVMKPEPAFATEEA